MILGKKSVNMLVKILGRRTCSVGEALGFFVLPHTHVTSSSSKANPSWKPSLKPSQKPSSCPSS